MRLCMIGNRGHNSYVWDGLQRMPHVRVVGITSGTTEDDVGPLQMTCESLGQLPEVFDDYRVMLDKLKPDVVSVVGPFEQHAEMSAEALRRGVHIFCEKPVALTLEQLAMLKDVYAASDGLHFGAMMGLRYNPAFYTAWRAMREGAIGTVRLLNAQKSYKLGQRAAYYRDRATYGGTIPWVGVHAIDWIHWFSGGAFESVYATHSTQFNHENGDLEMSALCHFTMSDGVFASASIDYLRPSTAHTHGDDRVRVMGTDGAIEVRGGAVYLINGETDGEVTLPVACEKQIFQDFVEHVEGKTTALLSPDDIFDVTEACLLARQSADEGRVVEFGD